jgi:hypothetical protein
MSGSKQPPDLPDVVDEAGDSPSWVPMLGLALLCALALLIAARQALHHDDSAAPEGAAAAGADGGVAAAAGDKPNAPPAQ